MDDVLNLIVFLNVYLRIFNYTVERILMFFFFFFLIYLPQEIFIPFDKKSQEEVQILIMTQWYSLAFKSTSIKWVVAPGSVIPIISWHIFVGQQWETTR